MSALLFPFMLIAAVGFVSSAAAHIASLAGVQPPGGGLVWSLHIGIFVVWIPTVLVATRITGGTDRKDFWKLVLSGCPAWMRQAGYVLFAYAILNFIWFAFTIGDAPKTQDHLPSPSIIRGFSGHWMVFYGAAFATLYSVIHAPQLLRKRTCPEGHPVTVTDSYCPSCGRALSTTDMPM